jgi:hypothetical protein
MKNVSKLSGYSDNTLREKRINCNINMNANISEIAGYKINIQNYMPLSIPMSHIGI